MTLALKQLGLYDQVRFLHKPSKAGRKLTDLITRQAIWKFWHDNSIESTNTKQIAKLRVTEKPHIQTNLEFVSTVTTVRQRNRLFYQSIHKIVEVPFKELFVKYIKENSESDHVSWGTFIALKPFYVRHTSSKDMEMCCCKLHLHARWSINALLDCCKLQSIDLGQINDYYSFFDYITSDCQKETTTYVSWQCVSVKNKLCDKIKQKWEELRATVKEASSINVTVPFVHFKKMPFKKKNGLIVDRLKTVKEDANINFITDFIDEILPKTIHHRNHLKHFRSVHHQFINFFDCAYIDVDFSENLSVPVKYEPQSLHWAHDQVTVHSGILKVQGYKSYHPYFSDSKLHDQVFVNEVLLEMLQNVDDFDKVDTILIESDSFNQYKCAQHFYHLQSISNKFNKNLICVYGVAGHGKGEVDHVGGLAKVIIRQRVAAGDVFLSSSTMVDYLNDKFKDSTNPEYVVKEIDCSLLEENRAAASLLAHPTIDGSSTFQVIVFKPNSDHLKAANRICVCQQCQKDYGSCNIFSSYPIICHKLNKTYLRSKVTEQTTLAESNAICDFIVADSFIAIAAEESSMDSIWFIKVTKIDCVGNGKDVDDYGHIIPTGVGYMMGNFLEKSSHSTKSSQTYTLSKKLTFFYKESVVYPYVNFQPCKNGFKLKMSDYTEILHFIEENSFCHL